MARHGRPPLTEVEAGEKAARVIEVAVALHNGQIRQLKRMGLSEPQAARLVGKRHRGRVGELIGDSLVALAPPINRTAAAVRLALDHEVPVRVVLRIYEMDRSNLVRAINAARKSRAVEANFLPQNTLLR